MELGVRENGDSRRGIQNKTTVTVCGTLMVHKDINSQDVSVLLESRVSR